MKKFQIICADPPYSFSDSLLMSDVPRGASANYSTMSIADIKNLPIKEIIDPDGAVLALWVPSSLLQEGLDILKAWGFKHKQTYVWVKTKKDPFKNLITSFKFNEFFVKNLFKNQLINIFKNFDLSKSLSFGMGRLFRQTHEICLIGINNAKIYKKLMNKSQRSVSFAENLKHSAKPENLQDSLELMFSGENINKVELFARRQRQGWLTLGNEVCEGEDIRDSLAKLY